MINKYKILNVAEVNPQWFAAVVQQSLGNARKSLDGTKVILTLPKGINSVDDVPEEWKSTFLAHEPYLTQQEAAMEMAKPEWSPPDEIVA